MMFMMLVPLVAVLPGRGTAGGVSPPVGAAAAGADAEEPPPASATPFVCSGKVCYMLLVTWQAALSSHYGYAHPCGKGRLTNFHAAACQSGVI